MEVTVVSDGIVKSTLVSLPRALVEKWDEYVCKFDSTILGEKFSRQPYRDLLFAWSGEITAAPIVKISSKLCQLRKISNESSAHLKISSIDEVASIPVAASVTVEPSSPDDWEIVEKEAGEIENQFLSQVSLLSVDTVIPFYLHNRTLILLKIVESKPSGNYVRVIAGSEIYVAPKPREKALLPANNSDEKKDGAEVLKRRKVKRKAIFRVCALSSALSIPNDVADSTVAQLNPKRLELGEQNDLEDDDQDYPGMNGHVKNVKQSETRFERFSNNFTSRLLATEIALCTEVAKWMNWQMGDFVKLRPLFEPRSEMDSSKEANSAQIKGLFSKSVNVHIRVSDSVPRGHVVIPDSIALQLNLTIFDGIVAEFNPVPEQELPKVENFVLEPLSNSAPSAQNKVYGLHPPSTELISSLTSWAGKNSVPRLSSPDAKSGKNDGSTSLLLSSGQIVRLDGNLYRVIVNPPELPGSSKLPSKMSSELFNEAAKKLSPLSEHMFGGQLQSAASLAQSISNTATISNSINSADNFEQFVENEIKAGKIYRFNHSFAELAKSLKGVLSTSLPNSIVSTAKWPHLSINVNFGSNLADIGLTNVPPRLLAAADQLAGVQTIISAVMAPFEPMQRVNRLFVSVSRPASAMSVLVTGQHGSGKSLISSYVAIELFKKSSIPLNIVFISCSEFAGLRLRQVRSKFTSLFESALHRQPSLIILDDLDLLVPVIDSHSPSPLNEPAQSAIISQFILTQMRKLRSNGDFVGLIATGQETQKFNADLLAGDLFGTRVIIPPPDQNARIDIFKKLFEVKKIQLEPEIDTAVLGYSASDLSQFIDRARHLSSMRILSKLASSEPAPPTITLSLPDIDAAFESFTPASLKSAGLFDSGVSWKDIGGLEGVRDEIKQTLEWPTRYSFLYSACPLRLRSGMLLYGPPGCGKTLLACAAAKECGLNVLVVKGAELLNKYIGASEEAVRQKFAMAQSAAPCVLFFDEFDAIAPRRGHDNTGVTDRVVNQFLTALDGVEKLEGVFVLAATSRPDLIDPALLRPGRLDKCLYVGPPDREELESILRVQARAMTLGSDVDMQDFASSCYKRGLTGADTQALLYNAQLEAIHRSGITYDAISDRSKSTDDQDVGVAGDLAILAVKEGQLTRDDVVQLSRRVKVIKDNVYKAYSKSSTSISASSAPGRSAVVIQRADLNRALGLLSPSLPPSERQRYEGLYSHFLSSRHASFVDTAAQTKRTTLM